MTAMMPPLHQRLPRAFLLPLLLAGFGCNDPAVRRIAGKEMGCPESRVTVSTEQNGDAGEIYNIAGCGKRGTLHCSAPDYNCFYVPAPSSVP